MNFNKLIFDIIVVAGQSNAEGNGLCFDKDKRVVFDDQYEMIDSNPCFIEPNTETHELICTFPVVTKIRKLQEREVDDKFFSDFSIAFAQDYLEKGYLKNGHKLLIVKAAVGGSGFTRKQQGVENVLYKRLVAMVDEALKLNKENKIVAFLWHQGEHDAFENIGRSKKYVYSFYKKSFLKQTVAFLNRFKKFNFPVITGGFCHSWRNLKENLINCKMVEKALIESCKEIGYASFVPSDGLKSNMETIKNCNDNIHFNRDSLFRLGHRYFERWEEMVNSRIFTYKKAKWIWNEKLSNIDAYCEFEVNFNIDKLGKYILYLSCAGTYAVYLNGKLITSMQSSDYSDYKYVDKICLERLNKKNKIIIQCWNQGVESYIFKKENSGLIFEIRDFDDKPTLWSSKSTPSRVMNEFKNGYKKYITIQQGLSFLFDFNAVKTDFVSSIEISKPNNFHIRRIPQLFFKKIKDYKIKYYDNQIIIDLLKECVGFPEFVVESSKEQLVSVYFGEHLNENNMVDRYIANRDFSFEIVLKKGINHFINPLKRFGLRFIQINYDYNIKINNFSFLESLNHLELKDISYKDNQINKINEIATRTLICCNHEHYEDCPWREQALYSLDSRNQMLCGNIVFEGNKYQRHNLIQIAQSLNDDGLLSITSPTDCKLSIPSFSLYFLIAVKEYLDYSGDVSILTEIKDSIFKIYNFFAKNIDKKTNLLPHFMEPYWNFYEWTDFSHNDSEINGNYLLNGYDLVINCLYILSCNYLNEIFHLNIDCSKTEESIKKHFYNVELHLYKLYSDCDQYSLFGNSLIVLAGIEDKKFVENLINNENLIDASLPLRGFFYDALLKSGSKYTNYILNDIKERYNKMINLSATTFFESEDGPSAFEGAGSMCHGWSALPVYYFRKILK